MYYGDKKESCVNIADALRCQGWTIYGYSEDQSDSMTDYYCPASWGGIAEKNGFVLCVDNKYSMGNSGKEIYEYSNNSQAGSYGEMAEKIKKLEAMTIERGATAGEEDNAKKLIEKIKLTHSQKEQTRENTKTLKYKFPEFQINPTACNWHIEKNGKILDKGKGAFQFSSLSYHYDIWKNEFIGSKTWANGTIKEISEEQQKGINKFKSFIARINNIACGVANMGDGTEETETEGLEQEARQGYEKITVIETKTVTKPVKTDRTIIQEGDILSFNGNYSHGGFWLVTRIWTNSKEKTCISYEILGSEKRGFQRLKNAKRYYNLEERIQKDIEAGKTILHEMKTFDESKEVEKWVKIDKSKKTTKTNNTNKESKQETKQEEQEQPAEQNKTEEIVENLLDNSTTIIENLGLNAETYSTSKEYKNAINEYLQKHNISITESIIEYLVKNDYNRLVGVLQTIKAESEQKQTKTEGMANMDTKTHIDTMQTKLKEGEATAEELKQYYVFLRDNSEAVNAVILDKLNNSPKHKNKHKKTKEGLIIEVYDNMITDLVYHVQDTFSYTMDFSDLKGSQQKAIEQIINSATDEKIKLRAEKRKADREARAEQMKEIIEAINNPQTLEDFKQVKMYRKTPITAEEQELYDYLYSVDQIQKREQVEKEKQEKAKINITASTDIYTILADIDTRDNSPLWVVKLNNRVERDEFNNISKQMKTINGYYSRFKGGFIFKYNPTIKLTRDQAEEQTQGTEQEELLSNNSDKLRKVADNMQNSIDDKRRERQTNTARRARMASGAEADADSMERMQGIIRNIANAMDNNELTLIKNIDSRVQIQTLEKILNMANWKYKSVNNIDYNIWYQSPITADIIRHAEIPSSTIYLRQLQSIINDIKDTEGFKLIANRLQKLINNAKPTDKHHDPLIDISDYDQEIDKIYKNTDILEGIYFETAVEERKRLLRMGIESVKELRAYLREYFNYRAVKTTVDPTEKKIKELERQYKLDQKGDINFTPSEVVEQLIEYAQIAHNSIVLEPSAGIGNIADKVKEITDNIDVCEQMFSYCELLKLKGHNVVGNDFLQYNNYNYYDCIIMNPPFSDEQNHLKHAYNLLKIGGRLVAITSPSWTYTSSNKSKEFRNWFDEKGGEIVQELESGTFEMTGVNSRIVVIEKHEETIQQAI